MKGHRLHVRRKMKENNGNYEKNEVKRYRMHVTRKMKEIEASLIKILMRISGLDLVSSFLELSHYSLFLSHTLGYLEFSWSTFALEQERKRRQDEAKIK